MWLYCLCGGGNLGPFGGMASSLLAFCTHFFFYLSSMTHSQHVCLGVAIFGTGDAQCGATLWGGNLGFGLGLGWG